MMGPNHGIFLIRTLLTMGSVRFGGTDTEVSRMVEKSHGVDDRKEVRMDTSVNYNNDATGSDDVTERQVMVDNNADGKFKEEKEVAVRKRK